MINYVFLVSWYKTTARTFIYMIEYSTSLLYANVMWHHIAISKLGLEIAFSNVAHFV